MIRDEMIAHRIGEAESEADSLVNRLGALVEHATSHDAPAHAALYEHVQGCLSAAAKQLHRARQIMANADPADYEGIPE